MPLDPVIAEGIKPPQVEDPITAFTRGLQARGAITQQQIQQLQLQQAKQQFADNRILQQAFAANGGKFDENLLPLGTQAGMSGSGLANLSKGILERQKTVAGINKDDADTASANATALLKKHEAIGQATTALIGTKPENRAAEYLTQKKRLEGEYHLHKPGEIPDTYQGDDWLMQAHNAYLSTADLAKEKEVQMGQQEAERKKALFPFQLASTQAETTQKQAGAAAQALSTVTDQSSYDQWRTNQPPEIQKKTSAIYSPVEVDRIRKSGMSADQQVTADLEQKKFEETKAQHLAELGQGAQRIGIEGRKAAIEAQTLQNTISQQQRAGENQLSAQFRQEKPVQNYQQAKEAFNNIQSAKKQGENGISDEALLFSFLRLIHPDQAVRESQINDVKAAAGKYGQALNLLPKALNGVQLTPAQRMQIQSLSTDIMNGHQANFDRATKLYRDKATRQNLNPDNVISDGLALNPASSDVTHTYDLVTKTIVPVKR